MSRAVDLDRENEDFEAPPTATRGLVQILWQRKAFVLLGACLGLALGFLYHTQRPTIYESGSMLVVQNKQSAIGSANANAQQASLVQDYIAQHLAVLKSTYIARAAIQKDKLTDLKTFENTGGVGAAIEAITTNLAVDRDKKLSPGTTNNIIVLAYRGPYPEDCKTILNSVIDSFSDFLDDSHHDRTGKALKEIKKARNDLSESIKASREKLYAFHKKSPVTVRSRDGQSGDYDIFMALSAKKTNEEVELLKLESEIRTLELAINEGKGLEFLTQMNLNKEEAQQIQNKKFIWEPLIQLKIEETKHLADYGQDHPKVKSIRAQIATMEKERKELAPALKGSDPVQQTLDGWRFRAKTLKETVANIEIMINKKKEEMKESTQFIFEEGELRQELKGLEDIHNGTVQAITQLDLSAPNTGFTVTPLQEPKFGVKVLPNAWQNLPAGLMLGLLVGVGLAYLADMADKSFRSPEEIRDQLGLPLVGHIPFFKPDPETTAKRAAGESTIEPMLCCYFKPKSLDSEAYRAVRTALFFSTQGQGHKVIQVTSPNKGDGKSLMIANLAITTAQSGKRVLMIDADCRRPRQHKIFNLPNEVGLTNVLTGLSTPQEAIREACVPGLFVMGSGPIPHNPSELLVSPRFKELLDSFRDHYDYVFVDTPPLLAVTDPCVVAGKVDGLFLAIRLTRKGRPDAERAREILKSVNVKVFGIVVNGVTRVTSGLYSSQAYDYTDTYVDYENEDKDYYYADEDPDEAKESKALTKK